MKTARPFFDTNILLYLLSEDNVKADHAETIISTGGVISVQVLNEFASVFLRKLGMAHTEIREMLQTILVVCITQPLTIETHELGLEIAERYGFLYMPVDRQCGPAIRLHYSVFGRYAEWPRN